MRAIVYVGATSVFLSITSDALRNIFCRVFMRTDGGLSPAEKMLLADATFWKGMRI